MYYLYILQSLNNERRYIGITEDTQRRIAEHNTGSVRSTKAYRPWRIERIESFPDKTSARKRELFLKKNHAARKTVLGVK